MFSYDVSLLPDDKVSTPTQDLFYNSIYRSVIFRYKIM